MDSLSVILCSCLPSERRQGWFQEKDSPSPVPSHGALPDDYYRLSAMKYQVVSNLEVGPSTIVLLFLTVSWRWNFEGALDCLVAVVQHHDALEVLELHQRLLAFEIEAHISVSSLTNSFETFEPKLTVCSLLKSPQHSTSSPSSASETEESIYIICRLPHIGKMNSSLA
jgi:hypothetical protein